MSDQNEPPNRSSAFLAVGCAVFLAFPAATEQTCQAQSVAGKLGKAKEIIGYQEIGTGFGFCTGQEVVAHFGLGNHTSCDIEVILPYGKGSISKRAVKADRLLVVLERLQ